MKPTLAVLHHFYYPDDVVSARLFQDLCEDLSGLGWAVEVWPSNRSCRKRDQKYSAFESHKNVQVNRVWRPNLQQESSFGRIFNSIWMITAWFFKFVFYPGKRPQVILISTDPVLGLLTAIGVRAVDSKVKIAHWCFDLYPEAAVADKKLKENGWTNRFLSWLMGKAYCACDVIVDLGVCMKKKLSQYPSRAIHETLTPWAFYEPAQVQSANISERKKLFDDASLGILYSGNFGLAHTADLAGQLARELVQDGVRFCFSIRGHAKKEFQRKCLMEEWPISFVEFAAEENLNLRLEATDIHMVSLKADWTGTVVPSKFFGALAAGRPVLFEGAEDSAIAQWIRAYELGWVLTLQNFSSVAASLKNISTNPEKLRKLQEHCLATYQRLFSRKAMIIQWNKLLLA